MKEAIPQLIAAAWLLWLGLVSVLAGGLYSLSLKKFSLVNEKAGFITLQVCQGNFLQTKLQDIIPWKYKKGNMSDRNVPFLDASGIMTKSLERDRDLMRPDLLVQASTTHWGRCDCICSLKWLDLTPSALGSASVWISHSAQVNFFLHSLPCSGFTAVSWTSTPKERKRLCFFLFPTHRESRMRQCGKGLPFHSASH